jgi:hypothetical protein
MIEQLFYFSKIYSDTIIFISLLLLFVVPILLVWKKLKAEELHCANLFMAMLLLVFEIVIVLLLLWAVILKQMGYYELFSMILFLSIIFLAFVYVLKRESL